LRVDGAAASGFRRRSTETVGKMPTESHKSAKSRDGAVGPRLAIAGGDGSTTSSSVAAVWRLHPVRPHRGGRHGDRLPREDRGVERVREDGGGQSDASGAHAAAR